MNEHACADRDRHVTGGGDIVSSALIDADPMSIASWCIVHQRFALRRSRSLESSRVISRHAIDFALVVWFSW